MLSNGSKDHSEDEQSHLNVLNIDILSYKLIYSSLQNQQPVQMLSNQRKSNVSIAPPQLYVTKQLQNNADKKHLRSHRKSLFQEMKMTETLIQNSINQQNKSRFKQRQRATQRIQTKNKRTPKKKLSKYSFEIELKFRQIRNITKCFENACKIKYQPQHASKMEQKQGNSHQISVTEASTTVQDNNLKQTKIQDHIDQHELIKDIKEKCNLGKSYVAEKKKTIFRSTYRIKSTNKLNQTHRQFKQINFTDIPRNEIETSFLKDDYHSIYFTKYANLQNPRLSKDPWRTKEDPFARTSRKCFQSQNAHSLQKFIVGGYQEEMNEFSDYFKLSKFIQTKSNFKTLQNIYNNIKKQSHISNVNMNKITEPTMLGIVSFLQNDVKMDEAEKKDFRKRLRLLD